MRTEVMRSIAVGLVSTVIGAGATVAAAQAQDNTALSTDPIQRQALKAFIRGQMDRDFSETMGFWQGGVCDTFYVKASKVNFTTPFGTERALRTQSRIYNTYLSPREREELIAYNLELHQRLPRDCPPKTAATMTAVATPQVAVTVSGGVSQAALPPVNGGTKFDPVSATEVKIASSARTLSGSSANVAVAVPTPRVFFSDTLFFNVGGSWFTGNANGGVPVGATGVAQTYIFQNPASGSTGILAGATGQTVQLDSDGHLIDIIIGLRNEGVRLPFFFGGGAQVPEASDRQIKPHVSLGARYRSMRLRHRIRQQSLFFPGLNSQIDLNQDSNFFGANFGFGVSTAPPGSQPGFVAGIDAFVAPGVLSTSGTATQVSNCVPCGGGSPEFNVSLRRDFSSSEFTVILGGQANVGYRFTPNMELSLFGTVEHMAGLPFFNVPTTPVQQPINLNGRDSVTTATVGARLAIAFGNRPN